MNPQRRFALSGFNLCSHQLERFNDAPHRSSAQRLVANELRRQIVSRKHAGEYAQGRTTVAAVQRFIRSSQCFATGKYQFVVFVFDRDTEVLQTRNG